MSQPLRVTPPVLQSPHPSVGSGTKRMMDVTIATVAIIILAPLFVLGSALIRATSRGPAFFRQESVGLGGGTFTLLKFRTMIVDNDDSAHREIVRAQLVGETSVGTSDGVYKLENDPRVTRVGSWLRRFSLDEVPQLINVLRGEMSIIGPRPALQMEVDLYPPAHMRRLDVLPGLTGLWQVSGRNRLSMLEMLDLDVRYVEEWSIWLDLKILVGTPAALLRGDGAR